MLDILRGEGWDLKERELTKLRKEQNLLLREPNRNGNGSEKRKKKRAGEDVDGQDDEVDEPLEKRARAVTPELALTLPPEIAAKRAARQARLIAESEERLKKGTRRRRTKVWSGIAPDPEAPPRYPSELTLEECKKELGLTRPMYMEIRDIFEDICRTNNVVKKTLCSADTWKRVKDELIGKSPHLQQIFWGPNAATVGQTQQPMAYEIVCMDVTKKIRTMGSRVTISEAKSILALTPQEGRDIRSAFDTILKEDYFVSKLDVPREHWESLKMRWIEESPLLREKFAGGLSDPDYTTKLKCLESIAADVQKRHRDHQTKTDPSHLTKSLNPTSTPSTTSPNGNQHSSNPAPSPARRGPAPTSSMIDRSNAPFPPGKSMGPPSQNPIPYQSANHTQSPHNTQPPPFSANGITNLASQAYANASQNPYLNYNTTDMQIDPTLLHAASLPSHHNQQLPPNYQATSSSPSLTTVPVTEASPETNTTPIYFRISPSSSLTHLATHPKIWLSTLTHPATLEQLRELALSKTTAGGEQRASVKKIEGVAPMEEGGGKWGIDEDDELQAYLEMVGRGKATFVVEIV